MQSLRQNWFVILAAVARVPHQDGWLSAAKMSVLQQYHVILDQHHTGHRGRLCVGILNNPLRIPVIGTWVLSYRRLYLL